LEVEARGGGDAAVVEAAAVESKLLDEIQFASDEARMLQVRPQCTADGASGAARGSNVTARQSVSA